MLERCFALWKPVYTESSEFHMELSEFPDPILGRTQLLRLTVAT